MSDTPTSFTFSHPILSLDPLARSLVRVAKYIFIIVFIGLAISLILSDVASLFWLGLFLTLVIVDYLIHMKRARYSVVQLYKGEVSDNNVALCADGDVISFCGSALDRVVHVGGDGLLALMLVLLEKAPLSRSLERLDISMKDFRARVEKEYEASLKASRVSTKDFLATLVPLFESAALLARFHSRQSVDEETLFSALVAMAHPPIVKILDLFAITPQDVDGAIAFSHFVYSRKYHIPQTTGGFALSMARVKPHRVNRTLTSRPTPTLDAFSRDLTDYARAGQVGFLIGHEKEYNQMIEGLCKMGAGKNVLLLGEAGVGKEAMVKHLAFAIISDMVSADLFDRRLVELSVPDLMSGASADALSARFKKVVDEIVRAGNIILYIPQAHNLVRSSASGAGVELFDMLVPVLKNSDFPVIASSYPREFKEYIEQRSDFFGSFDVVRVEEISIPEAIALLSYDAIVIERKARVRISLSALREAVVLGAKYLRPKPLPLSAQELLSEAVARAREGGTGRVDGASIIELVEEKVKVPIHRTTRQEADILLHLEDVIHKRYINQDHAVRAVSEALRAYRSGLSSPKGPIASFLFVGPTGVGKTELSKIITDVQFGADSFMIRFDMSEYQQKESVMRFIGSPDGRIVGALSEGVMRSPYSLVLLDEFEKAHPDILNLFLQVLDEGYITDALGRHVDFSNTIIVATSNAESVFIQDHILKGDDIDSFSGVLKEKLTTHFRPELLNRFSGVIVFRPLSLDSIEKIARLKIGALCERVATSQGIGLMFDDGAVALLAKFGYDPAFGARPIARAMDEHITAVLSKKILAGDFVRGSKVTVSVAQGGDAFVFFVS